MIGSGYRRSLGLMKTHAGETKSELMICANNETYNKQHR